MKYTVPKLLLPAAVVAFGVQDPAFYPVAAVGLIWLAIVVPIVGVVWLVRLARYVDRRSSSRATV